MCGDVVNDRISSVLNVLVWCFFTFSKYILIPQFQKHIILLWLLFFNFGQKKKSLEIINIVPPLQDKNTGGKINWFIKQAWCGKNMGIQQFFSPFLPVILLVTHS